MQQHVKFKVDRVRNVEVVRGTDVLYIKSSKGNNSITLGPTERKFLSHTTAGDDETTCEV